MLIRDALLCGLERIDAELLLAHVLRKERTWLLAHNDVALSADEASLWESVVQRRAAHEPVAYIIGEKEFYGRTFFVDPSVLIPRPATEVLVDAALKALRGEKIPNVIEADTDIVIASQFKSDTAHITLVADIGTGSGCIAITLACERPDLKIIATDISEDALNVARKNAERHNVSDRITFVHGDGMNPLQDIDNDFLVVSNPPYIPEEMELMEDVKEFEPHEALFAGEKGTDVIAAILRDTEINPYCIGSVMECRREQVEEIQTML